MKRVCVTSKEGKVEKDKVGKKKIFKRYAKEPSGLYGGSSEAAAAGGA